MWRSGKSGSMILIRTLLMLIDCKSKSFRSNRLNNYFERYFYYILMQRLGRQSSSRSRSSNLNTEMRIRSSTNSTIPPQSGVLGSRRRSYESQVQFEESSSLTQRRRITPASGNVGSRTIYPGEERCFPIY
ncbi:unnamed protein product [Brassica oleracea var. botrytis]|uniref:Uncharacterized protein n=2 Tax=Brassica TaxID=3705 RepID=A0A3P6DKX7_BRAOL|nr:hypothetical protein HID58_084303 [Brassica napus]CAF1715664.1 unnamed protein product [Brassica napus]VDD28010.1 unnamed protein product [Brassica oleracea]